VRRRGVLSGPAGRVPGGGRAGVRLVALAIVGLLTAVGVAMASAPASWVDFALRQLSLDRVRLADASGSLWQGEGRIVLLEGAAGSEVTEGFALPGVLRWELRPLPLVAGLVDAVVSLPGMAQPIRVNGSLGEWRIEGGALELPSAQLSRLGSPWNTIQPSAALGLRWEALTIRAGVPDGRMTIDLRDVASAMTPVRPLGTYRVDVLAAGGKVDLTLSTLSGALRLQGGGRWDRRTGLRFEAQAQAEGQDRARLQSLLGLIGRRDGDRTVIRIGG
jgi:general secretion pathway protein N